MKQDDPLIKTGSSQNSDPHKAVQELYDAIYQPDVSFALFYCSPDYDLAKLETALAEKFANIPLIGCTTAGEITPDGFLEGSITGVTIHSKKLKVETALLPLKNFSGDEVRSAHEMLCQKIEQAHCEPAACSGGPCGDWKGFMLLMIDGLSEMEERVVGALREATKALPLVGGSAGDGDRFEQTAVYYHGKFHTSSALLTLVCTALPFVTFKTENFIDTGGKKMVVTEADVASRIVTEINGLPAVTGYAELFGVDEKALTLEFFATHPVVVKLGDQFFVRSISPSKKDLLVTGQNGLKFGCAIAEGIVLTPVEEIDNITNLETAFAELHEQIGDPLLTLGFDCLYRKRQYAHANIQDDMAQIMRDNKVIGFHTYGEQFGSLHVNQTFTAVAFGKEQS